MMQPELGNELLSVRLVVLDNTAKIIYPHWNKRDTVCHVQTLKSAKVGECRLGSRNHEIPNPYHNNYTVNTQTAEYYFQQTYFVRQVYKQLKKDKKFRLFPLNDRTNRPF